NSLSSGAVDEPSNQVLNLLRAFGAVPEENPPAMREASLRFVEMPSKIFIRLFYSPHQFGIIPLHCIENVVGDIAKPTRLGGGESIESSRCIILTGKDDSKHIKRLVRICFEGRLL